MKVYLFSAPIIFVLFYPLCVTATFKISLNRNKSFVFSIPAIKQESKNSVSIPKDTQSSTPIIGGSTFSKDIYFEKSFDKAMISNDADTHAYKNFLQKSSDKNFINVVKAQYDYYVQNVDVLHCDQPRIPKIIHQIWVGPHPFPQEALAWQETWIALHPDWEYKLWTNEDVAQLEFDNKVYYDQAKNWGEKADILRYEILYRFGGLYADIDQSCLKPFDVLHHTCDFYTGIHAMPLITVKGNNKLRIANGVIACIPGHPIMSQVVNQVKKERANSNLLARTGPDFFTKVINQVLKSSLEAGNCDVILPANYFYPCAKRAHGSFKIESNAQVYIKPETCGVQYYTSYWVTPPSN